MLRTMPAEDLDLQLRLMALEATLRSLNAELAADPQTRLWWASGEAEEFQLSILLMQGEDGTRH
jgi:hypothetical protein